MERSKQSLTKCVDDNMPNKRAAESMESALALVHSIWCSYTLCVSRLACMGLVCNPCSMLVRKNGSVLAFKYSSKQA